jgi:hypothetical protein
VNLATFTDTGTVTAVNDNPVAVSDTASTAEDTPLVLLASALVTNDTDIDGNPLTVTSVQSVSIARRRRP